MTPVRSKKTPKLRAQRSYCMRQARLAEHPAIRDAFVDVARRINGVLIRSHTRATWRAAELRAVLESLS